MESPKFCAHCGAPLYQGSKFCPKCGKPVLKVEEEQPKEVPQEPVVEETPKEAPIVEANKKPTEETPKETPIESSKTPVEEVKKPTEVPEETSEENKSPVEEKNDVGEDKPDSNKPTETMETVKNVVNELTNDNSILKKTLLMTGAAYAFGHIPLTEKEKKEDKDIQDLLEPRKQFVEVLQREHEQNAIDYFDELVKKSGVDIEENTRTIGERNKLASNKSALEKRLSKIKTKGPFNVLGGLCLTIGGAALILMIVFNIVDITADLGMTPDLVTLIFILSGVLIGLGIIFFVIQAVRGKKADRAFGPKIKELDGKIKELDNIAYQQMAPLNNLFDFNILNILLRKTTPLIKVDDHPDMTKVEALMNKFNWNHDFGRYNSTLYMKTGSIKGNPFLFYRSRNERMVNETYTGTLTIVWTKKVTIGKNTTYIPMTQVLTASVTKPRPDYSMHVEFVYGSEAAPNLSFSRRPMIHDYSEKGLKKLYKEREKFVDNYARSHPNFTPLGNDEFEDYFDGLDRNNEVEYRLLFTPLAQRSMLDIIKNKEPFGDNFSFRKDKMINTIFDYRLTAAELEGDPRLFQGNSYNDMRANFIKMNKDYFKNMYSQLAPLLAIPLYQQYPTNEYIFKRDQVRPFSSDLCEMLSNRFYPKYFAPEGCATPIMLKCDHIRVDGNSVQTDIYAYGYKKIAHTEYFSKLGGDGYYHDVPVTWYEYIPIQKVTPFVVHETYLNKFQYDTVNKIDEYKSIYQKNVSNNGFSFFKGYFTFTKGGSGDYSPSPLNDLIKKNLEKDD